jgi:hypothetical protein
LATQLDRIIDRLEEINREVLEVKRRLTMVAPLPPKLKPGLIRGQEVIDPIIAEAYFDTVRGTIQAFEDVPDNFQRNVVEPVMRKPAQAKKVRTKAQKRNDKLQSRAFKNANSALRKSNGQMRKGVNQRDIARRAQKELRKLKKTIPKRGKKAIKSVRRRVKR